jgi:hypothetical protein
MRHVEMSILFVILIPRLTIYHDYHGAIKLTQAQIEKLGWIMPCRPLRSASRRLQARAELAQAPKKGASF